MASSTAEAGTEPVDTPADLTRADYVAAFKSTLKEVKDDDVPGLAGGVAFKIFMSIFPSLIAAVAIFGLVMNTAEMAEWLREARGFLPQQVIDLIAPFLDDLTKTKQSTASFTALAGVATGLFAATSAAISMMKALSRAYDVQETRKFVRQRTVALLITLSLVVALAAIVLLLVVGRQVQESVLPGVPAPLDWLLVAARFALALVVLVLLFAFVYWIGPNRDHPSWVWMSPGALFGVVGWLIVAGGFTLYVQLMGGENYNKTYGAIAGVVVLLLWLQLSMLVILIGAEFNAEVERRRAVIVRVTEGAGFAMPAPAAGLAPDGMVAAAQVRESEVAADTLVVAPPHGPTHSPAGAPLALGATPTASAMTASTATRRNNVAVAAAMAAAVFLGFARRRTRG